MKLNKLFHWLYFSVMMLPIFILPIFALAVRSDNNFQPIEITAYEQQFYDSNIVATYEDIRVGNIYKWNDHYLGGEYGNFSIYVNKDLFLQQFPQENANLITGVRFYQDNNQSVYYQIQFTGQSLEYINLNSVENYFVVESIYGAENIPLGILERIVYTDYVYSKGFQYVTYNDTDVGSQMVYTMYQSVNKYFNFDNVFNFGDLYSWLQLNFFNGTAPIGFFIFWHLLIYWLLVSLLWLLFDVLTYVPMLLHKWLDKASIS